MHVVETYLSCWVGHSLALSTAAASLQGAESHVEDKCHENGVYHGHDDGNNDDSVAAQFGLRAAF